MSLVSLEYTPGGGGAAAGLFLAYEDIGRMLEYSFPACAFFSKRRLVRAHQFHSLGQDQSTVAQRTEKTGPSVP